MIESPYPQTSDVSYLRVKRFVKHVIRAAKKQEEKKKAEQALAKQIEKVKKVAIKKVKKSDSDKELKKFEKKLADFLIKEGRLKAEEGEKGVISKATHVELDRLNQKVKNLSAKDAYVIEMLAGKIKELEDELKITEQARQKEESENKFDIEQLSQAILDQRERLKKFIESKNERDKRMEEIEKKIKEKVGKNYDEIVKLEKQLQEMEAMYGLIKEKGVSDKEIEDRIKLIKQRLIMKRAGIGAEEAKFIPTIKKKEKKRGLFFRKKTIPTGPVRLVKHELKIIPVKEKPEPVNSGKLPSIPPGPPVPKELIKELKKEHVIPTFFDKIKGIFKRKPKTTYPGELPPLKIEHEEIIY